MAQVAEAPELDPGLDAYQILKLADARMHRYAARDNLYETYARYYFGHQRGMGAPSVRIMNAQGRPLLRDLEQGGVGGEQEYRSQRLAPVIDDAQALLGRMPASRVEPPDPEPAGLERGQKLTKYLVSTHELSRMDRQQADIGFHLPCLGDGCYLLDVEPKLRRVVWTVVDPRCAYPSFMWGYRRFDIMDLILREYWDPYEAAARFGSDPAFDLEGGKSVVTTYISQFQRTVVVGQEHHPEVVRETRWKLGFCPAVWVFNKVNGGFAQSDIAQSLVQQDALDFMTTVFLDGIVLSTYSIPVIKGPTNLGQDGIIFGPNPSPVTVGDTGDLQFRSPHSDLSFLQFGMQAMQNEIYAGTGSSEARQTGQLHSSIQTGRAIHAAQGPQATRVELKLQEMGAAIQRANEMTLEMQEKAPYLGNHEFEIWGRMRGRSFQEKFNPRKDIDGWYRNTVHWEPVTGMNLQQKTAVAYEAKAAKLIDSERAMELMGEDDPMGMIERVRNEQLKDAELQAKIQGMLGGQQPGAPGGGADPPSASQAPPGSPAPPTRLARPPGLTPPPLASGVPQGVSREAVEQALQLVADKLTGTVAVVGELAQSGSGQHIEVLISDFRDYGRVAPVLKALDPKAEVRAVPEDRWPKDAVRVL